MKLDPGAAASLKAVLMHDIEAVNKLQERLDSVEPGSSVQGEYPQMAAVAYCLHNIYNALENSFEQISRSIENHIVDRAQWHKELLGKMFLNMPPLRPRVLPDEVRKTLNDLRGFRHLFRHAYDFELDNRRLTQLLEDWRANRDAGLGALREFALQLGDSDAD